MSTYYYQIVVSAPEKGVEPKVAFVTLDHAKLIDQDKARTDLILDRIVQHYKDCGYPDTYWAATNADDPRIRYYTDHQPTNILHAAEFLTFIEDKFLGQDPIVIPPLKRRKVRVERTTKDYYVVEVDSYDDNDACSLAYENAIECHYDNEDWTETENYFDTEIYKED